MDSLGGFGNNQEFRTDPSDPDASVTKTRNKVVAYIQKRMEDMKIAALSPRERAALAAKNKPKQRDLTTEYNEFIEMATNTLNGTKPVSRSVLTDKYDHLMYSERFLTDEQMTKLMELVTELDI